MLDADSNEGYLLVTGHFNSLDVPSEMKFRELGIFAQGEDEVEKLYAYVNDGDDAGTLMPNLSNIYSEQEITLVLAIGEAENVTAMLVPDTLYAPKSDFDAHVADNNNPHGVTKAQVGLANVPNVGTNNQTPTYTVASSLTALASGEILSTAFGKISKAVSTLISHIANKNNPHAVTRAQIGAAASSHTHYASDITNLSAFITTRDLTVHKKINAGNGDTITFTVPTISGYEPFAIIPLTMGLNGVSGSPNAGIYSITSPTQKSGYIQVENREASQKDIEVKLMIVYKKIS